MRDHRNPFQWQLGSANALAPASIGMIDLFQLTFNPEKVVKLFIINNAAASDSFGSFRNGNKLLP